MDATTPRTRDWKSTYALVVISPAMTTRPGAVRVSAATRLKGSCSRQASRIASEIWSAILSGWPSVTDSEVNRNLSRGCDKTSFLLYLLCHPAGMSLGIHSGVEVRLAGCPNKKRLGRHIYRTRPGEDAAKINRAKCARSLLTGRFPLSMGRDF